MIVPFREDNARVGMFLVYHNYSVYRIEKVNRKLADLLSFGTLINGKLVEHDDKMILRGIHLSNFNQAYVHGVKMK